MISSHGVAEATLWHQNLQRTAVWSAALRSFCPRPCFCGFDTVWAETGRLLPPERFVLEILEMVTFDEALFKRCSELRRAGFRLALDDVSQISPRLLEL